MYDKFGDDDWQAILQSLEKGLSIKSTPRNRGFGLDNLLDFTEYSNGTLQIISHDGLVIKKVGIMYQAGNWNFKFKGILIKFRVDLNFFGEIDDTAEIFEF